MGTRAPKLRKQFIEYERAGFHVIDVVPSRGKGNHIMVRFAEFSQPQFLTPHTNDPRALKNNIAHFRRLAAQEKQ